MGYKKFYISVSDKVFMVSYYDFSPADFLENEWLVFAGVFLLVFAMVFLALSNMFSRKKKNKAFPWLAETESNKTIPGVIAMVIALFSAAAFVRNNLIEGIFGEAITAWILLIVLIVLVMLAIPFYKALKVNVGAAPAIFILLFGVWAILKFGFDPYQYDLPSAFYDFYEFFIETSVVGLVVIIIIGVVVLLMQKSSRGR